MFVAEIDVLSNSQRSVLFRTHWTYKYALSSHQTSERRCSNVILRLCHYRESRIMFDFSAEYSCKNNSAKKNSLKLPPSKNLLLRLSIKSLFESPGTTFHSQPANSLKSNAGGVSFCWIGIQYAVPYRQKNTPPHCFFWKFAGWVRTYCATAKQITYRTLRRNKLPNRKKLQKQAVCGGVCFRRYSNPFWTPIQ